jgi:hypothetical protein
VGYQVTQARLGDYDIIDGQVVEAADLSFPLLCFLLMMKSSRLREFIFML